MEFRIAPQVKYRTSRALCISKLRKMGLSSCFCHKIVLRSRLQEVLWVKVVLKVFNSYVVAVTMHYYIHEVAVDHAVDSVYWTNVAASLCSCV